MTIYTIQKEIKENICDNCKIKYQIDCINVEFSYGSNMDLENRNFCSDKCFYKWVIYNSNLLLEENKK